MYMAQDIININIKYGEGISQAIDRHLDKEFNQDVKLNLTEWNSVFNVIKNDTAGSTKQYSGGDEDIQNNKNYVVQEGNYQITKNAWQQILDLAKKSLGIVEKPETQVTEEGASSEPTEKSVSEPKAKSVLSNEEIVRNTLKNANLNPSEADFNDILAKYENIVAYYNKNSLEIDEAKINERVVNYAKGLQYHNAETQFALNDGGDSIVIDGVQEAVQNGDMDAFKAAFHQKAKEYIELYDSADGDGKISFDELIQMEEKELGRALTPEEKDIVQKDAINLMAVLNQDENLTTLDENEVAAYLWAMSKINDSNDEKTAHDITYKEWSASRESIGILSGTNLTDEQWVVVNQAFPIIKKTGMSLDELYTLKDLSSLSISEEEKSILSSALPLLNDNGFKQEMIDGYGKFSQALRNGYEGLKN